MTISATLANALPRMLPRSDDTRLALFAIRRLGGHGLADAHAARVMMEAFGREFRRPLLLLRAFMQELAGTASVPIQIAPCCCSRMTHSEHALVDVLIRAETQPAVAHLLLADLIAVRRVDAVLASAAAVAAAFADAGRPLTA